MTIEKTDEWGNTSVYEVVDRVPNGYEVWNIGRHAPEGYVPFCICYPDTYEVQLDKLKAVRMTAEEAEILRKASSWGLGSPTAIKRRYKRLNAKNKALADKALPILNRIFI